jgi:hypothetical protein
VDAGEAPERIAIVARQARPYVDLALRALDRFGVPATARRRYTYREIPVVRALLAYYGAASQGWTRPALADLAELPYLDARLDARVLNFVGFREAVRGLVGWEQALAALEREAVEHEVRREAAKEGRQRPPPAARRVAQARESFRAFAVAARELEHPRPLAEWIRGLAAFTRRDPWGIERRIYDVPEDRFDVAKRDLAGWRGLRQILDEWLEALEAWGGGDEVLDVAGFHARLQEMLAGDAALWTETARGVRVSEALAAAYRSFDHLFLVGMEAGRFPLHAPRSPILDEAERAGLVAAGLPLDVRADWDERERSLFRVLVAGARGSLVVSHASVGALGSEVIRSIFVDALAAVATEVPAAVDRACVFTPQMPLFRRREVAGHAASAARIERLRERGTPSPYTGWIERADLRAWLEREFGDDRLWSPTQLEAYARCPWAYFSGRLLRHERLEDPDEEMDPAVRGRVLHDALARFYDQAVARAGGRPVFLRQPDLEWAEPLLAAALDASLDAAGGTAWLGAPELRDAKREELRRILVGYLRWEAELHEDMFAGRKVNAPRMLRTAVFLHERTFDGVELVRSDVRFRYRGAVDRVEVGVDDRVADAGTFVAAVDYKATRGATPGGGDRAAWDDGVVLQLPLYAHALTQLVPGARVARVEYRALVQRQAVHQLELYQVDKKTGARYVNEADRARLEAGLDAVPRLVRRLRRGEFPAQPAPSCLCPSFCHAWDVCRVPGGPRSKQERR